MISRKDKSYRSFETCEPALHGERGGGGGGYREMSSDGGLALRLELLLHSLFSQEIKPVTSDELNCVRPLFFPRE